MSLEVEIVVAGGVGDLLASMLVDVCVAERWPVTTVLTTTQERLLPLVDRLVEADTEVLCIVPVPTPRG
ncbi:MAG TPA: hypothetical protein VK908_17885 [Jiangellales bacterium]|nr:hypothetical protein [Jiangellales bacterium]